MSLIYDDCAFKMLKVRKQENTHVEKLLYICCYSCSPVNLLTIFRTSFEGLFLFRSSLESCFWNLRGKTELWKLDFKLLAEQSQHVYLNLFGGKSAEWKMALIIFTFNNFIRYPWNASCFNFKVYFSKCYLNKIFYSQKFISWSKNIIKP